MLRAGRCAAASVDTGANVVIEDGNEIVEAALPRQRSVTSEYDKRVRGCRHGSAIWVEFYSQDVTVH